MVADGIVAAGRPPDTVTVELDEMKSMDLALGLVRAGDILLLLCDKHEAGWRTVEAFSLDPATAIDRLKSLPARQDAALPTTA